MSFFNNQSTQYLNAPSVRSSKHQERLHHVDDISSDLELSFASNVSLNSPPRDPISLTPESEYPKPMDISPAPPKPFGRPRAFTSALTNTSRAFGHDRSNESMHSTAAPPSLKAGSISGKRTQRSALPTEWFTAPVKTPDEPVFSVNTYPSEDAMDVDTSFEVPALSHPVPLSAAPTITGFNNLFYDTMSPAPNPKKQRRSLSPERVLAREHQLSSSPGLESSPSQDKLERIATGPLFPPLDKPRVEGLGAAPNLKRTRRPALSAMTHSAFPIVEKEPSLPSLPERTLPPTRRAFSAVIPGSVLGAHLVAEHQSSDESSFEGMSSPAQAYARRQQVKTIRRCDGTEDFRPLTGATAMVHNESPSAKFLSAGMPGFGDNESAGKLLPCHRVTDDGLMRINGETLNKLLDGHFSDLADYHIIDCRFDYEYNGGHIRGAINLNQTTDVEEFLLREALKKPKPCVSGDPARKTILVFHCEFSAKRAPTFAKHLRARDRALNNHVYPKIHYPELYILEGGYSRYFQSSSVRCDPPAYVTMDDPLHAASRDGGLDQLRKTKFGRHKSYAYGDGAKLAAQQQPKRNTVPAGPGSIFAAATAARSRRGGLTTLVEDGNVTADAEDTDEDQVGDSPCPPPPRANKKGPRGSLSRAETYGPARMPYH